MPARHISFVMRMHSNSGVPQHCIANDLRHSTSQAYDRTSAAAHQIPQPPTLHNTAIWRPGPP